MAEVFAEDRLTAGAMLDDRRVEELSSGRYAGAGIRVVAGETTGFAHTADLSEAGLLAAAGPPRPWPGRAEAGPRTVALGPAAAPRPRRRDASRAGAPRPRKLELLARADEAARATGGAITQVQVGYGDSRRRILIANSDGPLAEDDQVRTRFNVCAWPTATPGCRPATSRWPARRASRSSSASRSRTSPATAASGRWPSCRPGRPPGRGADRAGRRQRRHPLSRGLRARARSRPHRQGRLGLHRPDRRAGGEPARHPGRRRHRRLGEWGNFAVDDEGNRPARNVLIEKGVLTDYMWD